jgi:hypothetical protein
VKCYVKMLHLPPLLLHAVLQLQPRVRGARPLLTCHAVCAGGDAW